MKRIALLCAAFIGTAAAERVPNTQVYYFREFDSMTDANKSTVAVAEINDTEANTFFSFLCRNGQPDVYLQTKNDLLTTSDYDADRYPNLMYRVDSQQAKTLPSDGATDNGKIDLTTMAFDTARDQILVAAFKNAQSKVTVRILRNSASALDYTFYVKGFKQAMTAVNNCK
ncbi:hypothetical protein [Deinococcus puniceus]|uniref:Uncharacterized protein n=1 Tax=Deinococcus puniceus TaxID=1182568 RepID=A0A172TB21_9DEIO|nr:hypothetical protein [Deinococcus puniceus]ANE44023.1 hypothetical protein SU48_09810 [Deinococcus puniceus]